MRRLLLAWLILAAVRASPALAATYYMAPASPPGGWSAGSDSNNGLARTTPKLTLAGAVGVMSGGDTLIIADGIYAGAANRLSSTREFPSGRAGAYTVVRAEHPGRVVFDGEHVRTMLDFYASGHESYVVYEGLQFVNSSPSYGLSITGMSSTDRTMHHIKFLRCGFQHQIMIFYASYILLEDCYVTGEGRYNFEAIASDHVVFRRCVARLDSATGAPNGWPVSHFVNYASQHVEFQNCIAIDSDDAFYSNYEGLYGGFLIRGPWVPGDPLKTSTDTKIRGSLVLNVKHRVTTKFSALLTIGTVADQTAIENTIFWDVVSPNLTYQELAYLYSDVPVSRCTFGACAYSSPNATYGMRARYEDRDILQVSNSIFTGITNPGAGTSYALAYAETSVNNAFWGNDNDTLGVPAIGSITTVDPLAASLKYLTRIEAGSALATAGSDGGIVGATMVKRIGAAGTLWGEAGYATTTTEDLWPWPEEAAIRAFFRTYGQAKPDPARGFCAAGQTLTHYVWTYLGHAVPPFDVAAAAGPLKATLTWGVPSVATTITGYKVYRNVAGDWVQVGGTVPAGVYAVDVTSLSEGVEHEFAVTAVDASLGESARSESVYATPTAGRSPHRLERTGPARRIPR